MLYENRTTRNLELVRIKLIRAAFYEKEIICKYVYNYVLRCIKIVIERIPRYTKVDYIHKRQKKYSKAGK